MAFILYTGRWRLCVFCQNRRDCPAAESHSVGRPARQRPQLTAAPVSAAAPAAQAPTTHQQRDLVATAYDDGQCDRLTGRARRSLELGRAVLRKFGLCH